MASSSIKLKEDEISRVTDVISAKYRFRFAIEYLEINPNEYHTIESEAQFIHHDTLHECIRRWKNRTEAQEINPKDELIRILTEIRLTHGWFPGNDVSFLTDVSGMHLPQSRLKKIQEWTQKSLKTRLQKSLSHDWIHENKSVKFPLRQYYVQLDWKQKIRTAMGSKTVRLTSIHDLIKQLQQPGAGAGQMKSDSSSVLIEGEGGIGKSSSLGILALDWAENVRPELEQFDFVFLILLRYVEGNEPLEHIIMQQHGRLGNQKVSPLEVKAILEGETKSNILLMFDGYDEYTRATNDDIDKLLKNGIDNCLVIVSSRSGDFLEVIKIHTNEEVKITGFSQKNIIKCTEQYLGSEQSCQEFLSQAKQAGIHRNRNELLHVPIILLMACTVFLEYHCLPSSKTCLFQQVVSMCISRTTLKTMGKTASEVENLHNLIMKLGKLAWIALNRESKQLLLYKNDVLAESEEILKLGLLFGEDIQATTEDLPAVLSFQHKLIQEYLAAIYIVESVKTGESSTILAQTFQTWEKIDNHKEVVLFTSGMLAETDATPVTNHVATVLAQIIHNELDTGKEPSIMKRNDKHLPLLLSFQREGMVPTSMYPGCGRPLAEVLANTDLVCITDIDENDPLKLSASSQIIVNLRKVHVKKYDRLWNAISDIHGNIIALRLFGVSSANVTKLSHLPQLKYIYINECSKASGDDLAESIEAWGDQSQLTYCRLFKMPIPRSLMTGLYKCTHLIHLHIMWCNLHDKLDVFMASLPPGLRDVIFEQCSLHASDVDHMTQAVQGGRLTHLELLKICANPVGEVALGHLLEALISIRPHTQLKLVLWNTGVDEASDEGRKQYTGLSEQFVSECREKLTDTNIEVVNRPS